ncbi:MAG: DUF3429 domain-containing protein [Planktomarina sp.]
MTQIPRSALILGLAGTIPFVWGVITLIFPSIGLSFAQTFGPRFVGPYVQLSYGTVILAFMSGVLWGFAAKADRKAAIGYALSVIPALYAFFFVGGGPYSAAIYLALGFTGLICLDQLFTHWGLTPQWWMNLRILLTALVVACLITTVFLT